MIDEDGLRDLLKILIGRVVDEVYHLSPGETEPFLRDNFKASLNGTIDKAVLVLDNKTAQ